MRLQWNPPISNGGVEITNYVVNVTSTEVTWTSITTAVDMRMKTIILSYNVNYTISVTAVNCAGGGPPSALTVIIGDNCSVFYWPTCIYFCKVQQYMCMQVLLGMTIPFICIFAVNCSAPPTARGVILEPYNSTIEGEMIYFYCCRNSEKRTITCQSDGRWSTELSRELPIASCTGSDLVSTILDSRSNTL